MRTGGGWIRLFLVTGVVMLTACGRAAEADDAALRGATEDGDRFVRVINVEVRTLIAEPFTEVIRLTGVVEAEKDVTISAEEAGVVRELLVEKGSQVTVGQALVRVDDRILRSQTEQARAQAELAQETWIRRKRLWEEDQVGSEIAYLQAKYAARQMAANLATLEARLERTVIRAPISGILESRLVEIGTMVQSGTQVARIVDVNPVQVLGGVPEI